MLWNCRHELRYRGGMKTNARHKLLGAPVSYYTAKVRAYLQYKQIPYDEVLATREVYRDVIVPRTGVRFIPVLITDDDIAIQDSSAILDHLERRYPEPCIEPASRAAQLVAFLFETYADEWLVLPAMHYRWNVAENRAFAIEEFGRLSVPTASPDEQRAIGEKLAGPFAGALPWLGVSSATVPAIEASYRELLADFSAHLAAHPYLLGGRPSRGDFALFGPLYAHLYRDPASGRLMEELAPRVVDWVVRMRDRRPAAADHAPIEALGPTLTPLLSRMFREFGPVVLGTLERLRAVELPPDGVLPRALGTQTFQLGTAMGERAVYPFNAWRWQWAYDLYHALDEEERVRADRLLEAAEGLAWLQTPLERRLARVDNRLTFAS